ncbi:hypothetical protein L2E82_15374 [Cichorium intybus]|uniref:Uncharacterized protein n=1 Tax=Cichorium intybus TaxID=13427 RepID=A0ACB9F367_CICIN|nr:hypothetical protein L2E82_15374 [Cichorium intybus]
MKYLGGLFLALEFRYAAEAKKFLDNQSYWSDWFKWVKLGEYDLRFECVAWLKIIGLPIPLWDEENFSKIVSNFGQDNEDEMEEGEINDDKSVDDGPPVNMANESTSPERIKINEESPAVEVVESPLEHEKNKDTGNEILARDSSTTPNSKVNGERTFLNGPIENLVPSGWFGSFPSNMDRTNNQSNCPGTDPCNTFPGGSSVKRKWAEFTSHHSLPIRPFSLDEDLQVGSQCRNDTSTGGSIELDSDSSQSHSNEVEATAHVGSEVGFQIDAGNVILNEVLLKVESYIG